LIEDSSKNNLISELQRMLFVSEWNVSVKKLDIGFYFQTHLLTPDKK